MQTYLHNQGVMTAATSIATKDLLQALGTLANAGVSDTVLVQAMRELVDKPSMSAAEHPLAPAPVAAASPIDLGSPSGRPWPQAGSPSLTSHRSPIVESGSIEMVSADPVIVNFRAANGKRSSVSISPSRWRELLTLVPDSKSLAEVVKQYAAVAPAEGNRSNWVWEAVRKSKGVFRAPE